MKMTIEYMNYIAFLGIFSLLSYIFATVNAPNVWAEITNSTLLNEALSNPLIGTPLIVSNITEPVPERNDTLVINATNPILGNVSVVANFSHPIPINTCRNYSIGVEPRPTLTVYGVAPQPPLRTHFVEHRPISVSFSFTNNADRPISGQIWGGETPYSIVNLEKGSLPIIDVIQARAPSASKNAPLGNLAYYDNCSPTGEFRQPTVTARQIGDIHARYFVTLNNFFAEQTRALDDDTIVIGLSGRTGDQEYNKSVGAGDVDDYTQRDVNLRIGPFDIVPEDLRYLTFQYLVVNSGDSDIQRALGVVANAATAIASAAYPPGSAAFNAINQQLLQPFLDPDRCDGTVVADKLRVPAFTLSDWTTQYATGFNSYSQTRYYPGTESPGLPIPCGATSRYYATWTIERNPFEE